MKPFVPATPGQPDAAAVEQAVEWYVRLASGQQTEADHQAFRAWQAADPQHAQTWSTLAGLRASLSASGELLPGSLARTVLTQAAQHTSSAGQRRRLLKTLGWAGVGGTTLYLMQDVVPWRARMAGALADHSTGTGERRDLTLADGTRLMLNTATVVDVRFDSQRRRLALLRGEVLITTAPDAAQRPFSVSTPEGLLTPLGTRFTLRHDDIAGDGVTRLAVLDGAVRIAPLGHTQTEVVKAGQQVRFTRTAIGTAEPLDDTAHSWTEGMLTAEGMRLGDFIAELDRYRPGRLRCDPAVAGLTITGVWPMDRPDAAERVLASVERTLPVRVARLTRYWVTVGPR